MMDPEQPLWKGHPSHWHYFGWWVLGVILAPIVIGLGIIVWILLNRASRTYQVTPTKIIVEQGLLVKDSDELRLKDVRSIAVQRHGIKGWFDVGDIEFSSAARADADIVFGSIPKVTEVRDLVRVQQEQHDCGEPAPA